LHSFFPYIQWFSLGSNLRDTHADARTPAVHRPLALCLAGRTHTWFRVPAGGGRGWLHHVLGACGGDRLPGTRSRTLAHAVRLRHLPDCGARVQKHFLVFCRFCSGGSSRRQSHCGGRPCATVAAAAELSVRRDDSSGWGHERGGPEDRGEPAQRDQRRRSVGRHGDAHIGGRTAAGHRYATIRAAHLACHHGRDSFLRFHVLPVGAGDSGLLRGQGTAVGGPYGALHAARLLGIGPLATKGKRRYAAARSAGFLRLERDWPHSEEPVSVRSGAQSTIYSPVAIMGRFATAFPMDMKTASTPAGSAVAQDPDNHKIGNQHSPLFAVIRDRLRERILSGEFRPGARLVEGKLSAEMAVSRIPVREAL